MSNPKSGHEVLNLSNLAYRTATPLHEIREAGVKLFEQLSGQSPDLTKALVAASLASGLEPAKVLAIMTTLAEDFRQPVVEETARTVGQRLSDAGASAFAAASEKAGQLHGSLSAVEFAAVREDGQERLRDLRERLTDIDLAELGSRARKTGSALVENTQSLVSAASRLRRKRDAPDEAGKND